MPDIEVRKIASYREYTAEQIEDARRYASFWQEFFRTIAEDMPAMAWLIDDGVVRGPMSPIHSAWREHWMPDLRSGTATLLPECALQARP